MLPLLFTCVTPPETPIFAAFLALLTAASTATTTVPLISIHGAQQSALAVARCCLPAQLAVKMLDVANNLNDTNRRKLAVVVVVGDGGGTLEESTNNSIESRDGHTLQLLKKLLAQLSWQRQQHCKHWLPFPLFHSSSTSRTSRNHWTLTWRGWRGKNKRKEKS